MHTSSSEASYGLKAWMVCFAGSLFFFFEFIQMNMFNALSPSLIQDFKVTGAKLGQVSAYYFYAIVCCVFIAGIILDRCSTRKTILTAMTACVISTFLFSTTTEVWQAELCRLVTGIGGSFCFLSNVRLASRWFSPRRMALVIGCIVTFAMLGGTVAQTPLTLLVDSIGWRKTLVLDGCAGVLMLLIISLMVEDYPPGQARIEKHNREFPLLKTIWLAVRNAQNWLGGLYTSFMNLPIFLLGAMWGSLYLVQVHHLSRADASLVTTMIFVGTIVGSPFMGWLSDRMGRRRRPMIITAVLSLLVMLLVMYIPELSMTALLILFLLLGFFTSAQIISYPLIAESNPLALTGSAEGLAATLIMAGGFLQPLFGYLMELRWDHHTQNGLPLYSWGNYQLGMMIMPCAFVLAFFVSLLVRETYGRFYEAKGK
ncbi:MAG TPA: MFS transporter [Coxiellaceae bacterium]|nr:MFS transporter [Coxiellaceae bacterium]